MEGGGEREREIDRWRGEHQRKGHKERARASHRDCDRSRSRLLPPKPTPINSTRSPLAWSHAGLACGSDTSHLSMFGYDPRRYYRGRGAFETMGTGLEMLPGDIAFKVLSESPVHPLPLPLA